MKANYERRTTEKSWHVLLELGENTEGKKNASRIIKYILFTFYVVPLSPLGGTGPVGPICEPPKLANNDF